MDSTDVLYRFLCLGTEMNQKSHVCLVNNFKYIHNRLYPYDCQIDAYDIAQEWLYTFLNHPTKKEQICLQYSKGKNLFSTYLRRTFRNFTINYCMAEFNRRRKEIEDNAKNADEEYINFIENTATSSMPGPADDRLYEKSALVIDKLIRSLPESRIRVFLNSVRNRNTDDRDIFLEKQSIDNIHQLTSRMRKQLIGLLDQNEVCHDDFAYYLRSDYLIRLREDYSKVKEGTDVLHR